MTWEKEMIYERDDLAVWRNARGLPFGIRLARVSMAFPRGRWLEIVAALLDDLTEEECAELRNHTGRMARP